jgi:hypothetical protein
MILSPNVTCISTPEKLWYVALYDESGILILHYLSITAWQV